MSQWINPELTPPGVRVQLKHDAGREGAYLAERLHIDSTVHPVGGTILINEEADPGWDWQFEPRCVTAFTLGLLGMTKTDIATVQRTTRGEVGARMGRVHLALRIGQSETIGLAQRIAAA